MNLNRVFNDYINNGYSNANAISKTCQDIILSKINSKGLNKNVTIKECKNCQYRENKTLSNEIIYKHMYENNPIGIYPLLENI